MSQGEKKKTFYASFSLKFNHSLLTCSPVVFLGMSLALSPGLILRKVARTSGERSKYTER